MQVMVSIIGTLLFDISHYLVELIQLTLNKRKYKITNSSSFVNEAKNCLVQGNEVQEFCVFFFIPPYQLIKHSMF